ncbi:putative 60S ribosomal protein L31-like isoform 1 [Capsicum annuum]|nr:putative 60S ribosomal protein L31-like isoform 1 [Capsicum annuum]
MAKTRPKGSFYTHVSCLGVVIAHPGVQSHYLSVGAGKSIVGCRWIYLALLPKVYALDVLEKIGMMGLTRPDISYLVSVVSQFMDSPCNSHWDAVACIVRYIKSTPGGHGFKPWKQPLAEMQGKAAYDTPLLARFRWDILWLPLGPLSGAGVCIYVDYLLTVSSEEVRKLRGYMYAYKASFGAVTRSKANMLGQQTHQVSSAPTLIFGSSIPKGVRSHASASEEGSNVAKPLKKTSST